MKIQIRKWLIRYQNLRFIKVANQTMLALFPVILIGALSWTLSACFLNPSSLIGRLSHLNMWLPQSWFFRIILGDVFAVTSGMLALYAAWVSARQTSLIYGKEPLFSELFAVISYLLIFHHSLRGISNAIEMRYYSAYWFIIGVILGYVVGIIFAKLDSSKKQEKEGNSLFTLIQAHHKAIIITLFLALALHIGFALIRTYNLDQLAFQGITSYFSSHSSYLMLIIISLVTTFLMWLGFAGSLEFNNSVFNNEATANLNHYLLNGSYQKLPKNLIIYSIAGTENYVKDGLVPISSVEAGKYIYQGVVKHYTQITVTGRLAQHSALPQNEEVIGLIKRYILKPER